MREQFDEPLDLADRLLDGELERRAQIESLPELIGDYTIVPSLNAIAVVVGLGARSELDLDGLMSAIGEAALDLRVRGAWTGLGSTPMLVSVPGLPGQTELGMRAALYAILNGLAGDDAPVLPSGEALPPLTGVELQWTHEEDAGRCLEELAGLAAGGLLPPSIRTESVLARGQGGQPGSRSPNAQQRRDVTPGLSRGGSCAERSLATSRTHADRSLIWCPDAGDVELWDGSRPAGWCRSASL